MDDYLANFP